MFPEQDWWCDQNKTEVTGMKCDARNINGNVVCMSEAKVLISLYLDWIWNPNLDIYNSASHVVLSGSVMCVMSLRFLKHSFIS